MDRQLAAVLRDGPFHVALRDAISARGLALHRIQHRLHAEGVHVGLSTLSYWQSGRRRPEREDSLRAVAALEEILGLPAHSLLALLGPRRRRGRNAGLPAGSRPYEDIVNAARPLAALLAALDAPHSRLHMICSYEKVTVGPRRNASTFEILQAGEAHAETDRHIVFYQTDGDCEAVTFTALESCRVGRVMHDPKARLTVAELLFDRVLRVGDTQIFRYQVMDDSDVPSETYTRAFRFPVQNAVMKIQFDAAALPVRCWEFAGRRNDGADHKTQQQVTLGPHHEAHVVRTNLTPGVIGFRWEWQ